MKALITILAVLIGVCSSARADICEAVRYERVERVQAYLAANTNAASFVGEKQCTPLHFAAEHSSSNGIRILEMLLAKGAEVDARNHIHQTPLFWAVIQNNIPGTKVLLAHGAEVNARQDGGMTPPHWAALNGYCNLAKVLIENKVVVKARADGKTPMVLALAELKDYRKQRDMAMISRYEEMVSILQRSEARNDRSAESGRFAPNRIQRQQRLALVADVCVGHAP
jgi:hypothetical protein